MPTEIDAIVAGHSRLWLVVALDHNVDYQKACVQEFDARFKRLVQLDRGEIAMFLFEVQ